MTDTEQKEALLRAIEQCDSPHDRDVSKIDDADYDTVEQAALNLNHTLGRRVTNESFDENDLT